MSLRPCDVVLAQLRWDARLDTAAVVVVYEGRDGALLEVRLPIFVGKGIPTHRVRVIRVGALAIWDRAARIDLLATDPEAVVAAAAPASSSSSSSDAASDGAGTLTVATWNVLGEGAREDRHAPSQEERAAALVDAIVALDADVVALEEVEPSLAAALAVRPAITERYALVGTGAVELAGSLLLLAPPGAVEIATPRVSGRRRALIARLASGATVVVVHLASDHRGDRSAVRRDQLASLFPIIDATPGLVVIAGDLNEDGPGVVEALTARGFVDAWPALHDGHDERGGATFDPTTNAIARQISRAGRAVRLDRILARGGLPTQARIVASSVPPLSDHAALVVTLAPTAAATVARSRPSHDSACAIVPPRDRWPVIDAIRARLDPAFGRWPPHVNLVYPFVAPSELAVAERALAIALVDAQPFPLRLEGFGRFSHRDRRATVWLAPRADDDALATLQRTVEAAVPLPRDRDVTHHLTVAKCAREEEASLTRAGAPVIAPFPVETLTLFVRHAGRMRVHATVPLGRGWTLAQALDATGLVANEARTLAVARARALVEEAAREAGGGALVPIGSEALGVALAGSDVDLVWEQASSLETLAALLSRRGARARVVDGAFSRVLRALVDEVAVDVIVADEGARTAIADTEALRGRATAGFVAALRVVRVWAARRALVGAAACMPSSLAWAIVVADACASIADAELDVYVAALFRALATWRPGPVPLPGDRDAARALTPSTAELLDGELARAAALCSAPRVPWRALLAPLPVGGGLPVVAALLLDDDDADATHGRIAGRMRSLVDALAERSLRARPDPRPLLVDGRAAFAIGLEASDGSEINQESVRAVLERAGVPVKFLLDNFSS